MKSKHYSFGIRLGFALLLMAVIFRPITANESHFWARLNLQGGGVIEKMVKVEVGNADVVWAAGMNSGINRAVWNSGSSSYDPWIQYLPGHNTYGVDAISVYASGWYHEHVICGGQEWGALYQSAEDGFFSESLGNTSFSWHRPGYDLTYPGSWKKAFLHDVVFWANTDGTYPEDPSSQFLAILAKDLDIPTPPKRGVYKWSGSGFSRIDETGTNPPAQGFQHFYRDIEDNNTVYLIKNWSEGSDDYAALYKLSGSYANIKWEEIPPNSIPMTAPEPCRQAGIIIKSNNSFGD